MLVRFRGHVFGKDGDQWYVWEPRWDSMRPIDGYTWDGQRQVLEDERYLTDLFDPQFGQGDAAMQEKCLELTGQWADQMDAAPETPVPIGKWIVWWRDGWVALKNPTVSPDTWRARHTYLNTRPRTCRNPPRGKRSTKRTLK